VVTPVLSGALDGAQAATPSVMPTLTQPASMLPVQVFSSDSSFCKTEADGSPMHLECSQNMLTITEGESRRKADILLIRDYAIELQQFNLEVDVTSLAAEDVKTDQNAYGFYFTDSDGLYHAVRIQGQFFNFEAWPAMDLSRVDQRLNPSYSPFIQPAGLKNHFRLTCTSTACDLYANDVFIGRTQDGLTDNTQTIGLFAASGWDEVFGQISFSDLIISDLEGDSRESAPISFEDDLLADNDTFAQSGLSGAFNDYEEDGFHFSPVIPYSYYAAKTGPSLENMAVSVTVKMNINPEKSATQYAGLVCRSSQDGMYMAVIRADGTYSVFRDTPQRPFSLLAERASESILPGLTENKLLLECNGETISFYINDQMVESLTDRRYNLKFGRAGIYTKAGGEPDPEAVVFSDFSIEEIQ